jgi:hypothetical protein
MGMAKDVEPVNEAAVVGYTDQDFEWELVKEEAPDQITFDTIGDTLVALYQGMENVTFTQKNRDGTEEERTFWVLKFRLPSGPATVNGGYELVEAYKDIAPNTMTRTQLIKLVDVGQASPMKSYRIDQAKPKNADNSGA